MNNAENFFSSELPKWKRDWRWYKKKGVDVYEQKKNRENLFPLNVYLVCLVEPHVGMFQRQECLRKEEVEWHFNIFAARKTLLLLLWLEYAMSNCVSLLQKRSFLKERGEGWHWWNSFLLLGPGISFKLFSKVAKNRKLRWQPFVSYWQQTSGLHWLGSS